MVDLKTFQPIALFGAGVRFGHSGAVVCECKEIAFLTKAHWIDRPKEICVYKLVRPLSSTLRFAVINLCGLGPLAAVPDVVL